MKKLKQLIYPTNLNFKNVVFYYDFASIQFYSKKIYYQTLEELSNSIFSENEIVGTFKWNYTQVIKFENQTQVVFSF